MSFTGHDWTEWWVRLTRKLQVEKVCRMLPSFHRQNWTFIFVEFATSQRRRCSNDDGQLGGGFICGYLVVKSCTVVMFVFRRPKPYSSSPPRTNIVHFDIKAHQLQIVWRPRLQCHFKSCCVTLKQHDSPISRIGLTA